MSQKHIVTLGLIFLLVILSVFFIYQNKTPVKNPANPVSLKIGTENREYYYYLPSNPGNNLPAVIVLHGGGGPLGTAELMMEKSGWKQKAEQEGFLVIFPQGTLENPESPVNLTNDFGDSSRNIRDWNDGSGGTSSSRKNIQDVEFISKIIDDITSRFPVDRNRIFATGFSNGASMSLRLGIELSDKIKAVAPVAGALFVDTDRFANPVSLLSIVGSDDRLEDSYVKSQKNSGPIPSSTSRPSAPSRSQRAILAKNYLEIWRKLLSCAGGPQISKEDKLNITKFDCKNNSHIILYRIEGLKHVYPGLSDLFSPNPGPLGNSINATDTVWNFFKQQ